MDRLVLEQLALARQGDLDAFAYVATAFRDQLIAWARPLTSEPEDAAQQALLLAFSRLSELREPEAFAGWLRALVRSAAMRQHRRRRPDLVDAPDAQAPALEAVERSELRAAVAGAICRLTPNLQSVIEAHYMRGETLEEIAKALGLPLGTIKRRLHDAREQLRSKLAGFAPARGDDEWRG